MSRNVLRSTTSYPSNHPSILPTKFNPNQRRSTKEWDASTDLNNNKRFTSGRRSDGWNSGLGGDDRLLLPGPDGGEEVRHVDTLTAHLDHPGVLEHAPGGGPAGGFFFEAKETE